MTNSPTPTPIEEAADRVLAQMNDANQAELRAMARDELWRCHFGLAMGIRNSLKSPLFPPVPRHFGPIFLALK